MAKLSLDHVALPMFDAAGSLRFYRDVLGFPLQEALSGDDWEGRPWLMMIFTLPDRRQLALCTLQGTVHPKSELPREVTHVAFSCATAKELKSWRAHLDSEHVHYWEEEHGAQKSLYFQDPNQIVLELTTSTKQTTPNQDADQVVSSWLAKHETH